MKKFITAIVSLVLAGTMTVGLVACGNKTNPDDNKDDTNSNQPDDNNNEGDGNGDGNQEQDGASEEWAELFNDLYELDNYTYIAQNNITAGLKYNGEYITAETEIGNQFLAQSVSALLSEFGLDEANPTVTEETSTTKVDLTHGIIESPSSYDDSKNDYSIVEGTTVKEYGWRNSSDEEGFYEYIYSGYASNEQAIERVRENRNPFRFLLSEQLRGTGEYADVTGTIGELYEIFEYDEATGVYSATIAEDPLNPESEGFLMSVKVENGVINSFNLEMETEMNIAEEMGIPALNGLTYVMVISSGAEISEIGTTQITVPADLDEQVLYVSNSYAIPDEAAYKSMFYDSGYFGDESTIRMIVDSAPIGNNTSTTAEYNVAQNILRITTTVWSEDWGSETISSKLYWATDEGLKVYTAIYDDNSYSKIIGWSEPETEAITGDKDAALFAKLPAEMQIYFNLNGKPMAEQFGEFILSGYNNYYTCMNLEGTDYRVFLDYKYNETEERYSLSGYNIYDAKGFHMSIRVIFGSMLGWLLPE